MSEPSPRQVLYALVSGGFLIVILALVIGAAVSSIVPTWWTIVMATCLGALSAWCVFNWRKTVAVLFGAIGLFLIWAIGTLIVAT